MDQPRARSLSNPANLKLSNLRRIGPIEANHFGRVIQHQGDQFLTNATLLWSGSTKPIGAWPIIPDHQLTLNRSNMLIRNQPQTDQFLTDRTRLLWSGDNTMIGLDRSRVTDCVIARPQWSVKNQSVCVSYDHVESVEYGLALWSGDNKSHKLDWSRVTDCVIAQPQWSVKNQSVCVSYDHVESVEYRLALWSGDNKSPKANQFQPGHCGRVKKKSALIGSYETQKSELPLFGVAYAFSPSQCHLIPLQLMEGHPTLEKQPSHPFFMNRILCNIWNANIVAFWSIRKTTTRNHDYRY